jgi:hypothetical protein
LHVSRHWPLSASVGLRMKTQEIVDTVKAIVASPEISQYKVGLTLNSPRRRLQYLGKGFEHFVILDTWLSAATAVEKEQVVFRALTETSDKRSLVYRKYHLKSRDASTTRSLGGRKPESSDSYDLYMAW